MHQVIGTPSKSQRGCAAVGPASPVMPPGECAQIGYADVPIDIRRMIAHTVIEGTRDCYRAIVRQLSALYVVDREACSGVWRLAFERAFGRVGGVPNGEEKLCPYLLGVNTWREALVRTYKALHAVPKHDAWMWDGIKSWNTRELDARLALCGIIPSGAIADLLRARGASIIRFNSQIVKSHELIGIIVRASGLATSIGQDVLLLQALRLIDTFNANPAYADPSGKCCPALHQACMGESERPVNFLLSVGARTLLNYASGGRTPLMYAKTAAVWNELLQQGADPNHYAMWKDESAKFFPMHPLTLAARDNAPDKVQALLEARADPRAADGSALKEARKHEDQHPQMVALIEQHTREWGRR